MLQASRQSDASPVDRLNAKVPVALIQEASVDGLAAEYTNPSQEVIKRIGGVLSGNHLYLFPDKSYIYCEWADIEPLTVYDKGIWTFRDGYIELKSDPEVTWDPGVERRYMVVRRRSYRDEVMLVGTGGDLSYIEENAGNDPEWIFLIRSKGMRKRLKQKSAARLKAKLMAESWRPDFFKRQAP